MPNPGKPAPLKLIAGSRRLGKDAPTVALPVLHTLPTRPDWLTGPAAIAEWDRLAPLLVKNGLLTEACLSVLGHACALHGAIVRALTAGSQPKAATLGIYRQIINDFGLTPAAAKGVRPPTADQSRQSNRFQSRGMPCR